METPNWLKRQNGNKLQVVTSIQLYHMIHINKINNVQQTSIYITVCIYDPPGKRAIVIKKRRKRQSARRKTAEVDAAANLRRLRLRRRLWLLHLAGGVSSAPARWIILCYVISYYIKLAHIISLYYVSPSLSLYIYLYAYIYIYIYIYMYMLSLSLSVYM